MVLPDGRVTELGGWGKEPPGFDLVGVVVGSEGCFGLVTEIEVRLLPTPASVRTLLAIFEDVERAVAAVTDIIGSGLLPAALEIIDGETIRAVEASVFAAGYPVDAGAALVVEFDGTDAGLDSEAQRAEDCCLAAGAREVRRARDDAEREALWKGRKKAFGAMGRIAPDLLVQDATVPRSKLLRCCTGSLRSGTSTAFDLRTRFTLGTATSTRRFSSTGATRTRSRASNRLPRRS